jgi:hypothetical protein
MPGSGPKRLRLRVPQNLEGLGTRIGPSRRAEKGERHRLVRLAPWRRQGRLMGDDGGMGDPTLSEHVNLGANIFT